MYTTFGGSVDTPLLKTKLHIPPVRERLVSRPHLLEKLNDALQSKLSLVCAPAGFGKSTLLSEWVFHGNGSSMQLKISWLSLDEDDNDLCRFLSYFIGGLQNLEKDIGKGVISALQSSLGVNTESLLTTLLNEITEISGKVVFILDDYHVIESPSIDQAINFLLDHLPPNMHLIISSRIDPSLPLSRLRALGQVAEIRVRDLRFSQDEAASFFNQVMDLNLSPREVEEVEERTEGWVAGLQLAAISLQGSADIEGFVHSFTGGNHYILDYLADEVFSKQPPAVQQFLLKTSILLRLSSPLCDALTGNSDGKEMIEMLDRENLFIIPLDNERRWFRYHHLFAEFAQHRLHQTQPQLWPKLHCKASEWFAHQGSISEAIHHARAGNDLERTADLIEANGLNLIGKGAFTTVQKWIDSLPECVVEGRPSLCVFHAWASHFSQKINAVEPYLQKAELALKALDLPKDHRIIKDVRGQIATLRAWNAHRERNNSLAITLLTDAINDLGDGNPFVSTFANLNLGLACMDEGELVNAAACLREAVAKGFASDNEFAGLIAVSYLAAVFILQGRLHEAARLCRRTIREQEEKNAKPAPTMCMIYLRLGWVLAEWNDIDGFYDCMCLSLILADQIGYNSVVIAGAMAMEWEKQLLAEQGRTVEYSEEAAEIIYRVMPADATASISGLEAQHTKTYLFDDAYFDVWPGYSNHARARKLEIEGRTGEALELLFKIYESAREVEGTGLMIEARSREALIYLAEDNMDCAIKALEEALILGEPEGYIRTFVDHAEPMVHLLREAAARGILPDYTGKLLSAFGSAGKVETAGQTQPLIEPLSKRELEVLRLIAEGLSNDEICERLFLALSTVKGHNRNIFGKLQVGRRTEAVARAREMDLL